MARQLHSLAAVLLVAVFSASCEKDDDSSTSSNSGGNNTSTGGCSSGSVVVDGEGNSYNIVQIGDQCWMAKNLVATKYRDGSAIPNVTDNAAWAALTTGARCAYENNASYPATYGNLYNWYAVTDARGICPQGWHIPTDAEWTELTTYLGGEAVAGAKMKSTTLWQPSSFSTPTNESGFTALPSGARYMGGYSGLGLSGDCWSATAVNSDMANSLILDNEYDSAPLEQRLKLDGRCVRCLKD